MIPLLLNFPSASIFILKYTLCFEVINWRIEEEKLRVYEKSYKLWLWWFVGGVLGVEEEGFVCFGFSGFGWFCFFCCCLEV